MVDRELKNIILERLGIELKTVSKNDISAIVYEGCGPDISSREKIEHMKKMLKDYGYEFNITYKKVKHNKYEKLAIRWAEEHGIVEYRVSGRFLIYNVSYPAMAREPRRTYQFKVDLEAGKTVESKQLKRYDLKGVYNRH